MYTQSLMALSNNRSLGASIETIIHDWPVGHSIPHLGVATSICSSNRNSCGPTLRRYSIWAFSELVSCHDMQRPLPWRHSTTLRTPISDCPEKEQARAPTLKGIQLVFDPAIMAILQCVLSNFGRWVRLKKYQYEVTFAIYMLTPAEKFIFSTWPPFSSICPLDPVSVHTPR